MGTKITVQVSLQKTQEAPQGSGLVLLGLSLRVNCTAGHGLGPRGRQEGGVMALPPGSPQTPPERPRRNLTQKVTPPKGRFLERPSPAGVWLTSAQGAPALSCSEAGRQPGLGWRPRAGPWELGGSGGGERKAKGRSPRGMGSAQGPLAASAHSASPVRNGHEAQAPPAPHQKCGPANWPIRSGVLVEKG